MDKKIITRAERQERLTARNQKLNDHINQGVKDYVQSAYNDSKEARKTQRWYETGEALVEAKIQGQLDADKEFAEEFSNWAQKEQEAFYAELDAKEQKMLEAEDDVIDVEFKPLTPMLMPLGNRRQSKLLGGAYVAPLSISSHSALPSLPSSNEDKNNKYGDI